MELTKEQLACKHSAINTMNLVEGYSGVGKSIVLLERFLSLKKSEVEALILVRNDYKKFYLNLLAKSHYQEDLSDSILTLSEFIAQYIQTLNMRLFENRLTEEEKSSIIESFIDFDKANELDLNLETILQEIDFIQENICTNEEADMATILQREFIHYYQYSRKYSVKGLLNQPQKMFIWDIYCLYMKHSLEYDVFDERLLYQSVLRLLYKQQTMGDIPYLCRYLLIDDIQDFSVVELDIVDKLFERNNNYYLMMTHDPLQSFDRYHFYENASLIKNARNRYVLTKNFKNSPNIHRIIHSNLKNNELFDMKLPYESANPEDPSLRPVLTFYYHKLKDEKIDVIFDRLDLLLNQLNYRLEDILIVFYDETSYDSLALELQKDGIPLISIKERLLHRKSGIVYMLKDDIISIPFKVVILYDADNKKIGHGHINRLINIQQNYRDSVLFYQSIANATELLIVQTSVSDPSSFLLPAAIDHQTFTFEIGSQFSIKSQLNVLRRRDFIEWISNQLIEHYGYKKEDISSHHTFDLIISNGNEQIVLKIHEPFVDDEEIGQIIRKGLQYDYIVLFDNYHYIVYRNIRNSFVRELDIPKRVKQRKLSFNRFKS